MSTVVAALTLRVYLLFLLQAEDGIRDGHVTGVQTCALPISWRPEPNNFVHVRQPLKVVPGQADLPAGYRIEDYFPPKDNYGREQLFEALGLDVAPDGTLVVATRTAGIWRLVDGEWQLFADGLFDSLGVIVEDEQGLTMVVSQKAELTRISDTNGDGRADRFDTLFDAHSFHGNYHT